MPQEQNVDVVREVWDACLRGDVNDLFAFFHTEITHDERSKALQAAGLSG